MLNPTGTAAGMPLDQTCSQIALPLPSYSPISSPASLYT